MMKEELKRRFLALVRELKPTVGSILWDLIQQMPMHGLGDGTLDYHPHGICKQWNMSKYMVGSLIQNELCTRGLVEKRKHKQLKRSVYWINFDKIEEIVKRG
jgi:hypothetical protein